MIMVVYFLIMMDRRSGCGHCGHLALRVRCDVWPEVVPALYRISLQCLYVMFSVSLIFLIIDLLAHEF
jgi:hypothetical protein